jgi:acyl-CoA thioesterase FadM
MTTIGVLRSRQIVFHYALAGQDGRVLATGSTEHMCVDLANRRARIPAPVAAVLQAFAQR